MVTQNVDGFHQAAGSRKVVELHGSEVHAICLNRPLTKGACNAPELRGTRGDEVDGPDKGTPSSFIVPSSKARSP